MEITRKQLRLRENPLWVEDKKRGGFRPGAGRKAGSGKGSTPQVSVRLADDERDAWDANGGAPYLRRLIREDIAKTKISRQALLDWVAQREAELGDAATYADRVWIADLRALLET